jgi:hypothetical protein
MIRHDGQDCEGSVRDHSDRRTLHVTISDTCKDARDALFSHLVQTDSRWTGFQLTTSGGVQVNFSGSLSSISKSAVADLLVRALQTVARDISSSVPSIHRRRTDELSTPPVAA